MKPLAADEMFEGIDIDDVNHETLTLLKILTFLFFREL